MRRKRAKITPELGAAIRAKRRELGLTLAQLEDRMEVSEAQLSRIEKGGGTSYQILQQLAKHLEMPELERKPQAMVRAEIVQRIDRLPEEKQVQLLHALEVLGFNMAAA